MSGACDKLSSGRSKRKHARKRGLNPDRKRNREGGKRRKFESGIIVLGAFIAEHRLPRERR